MFKRGNYSSSVLESVSAGFKGKLERLRYEYDRRTGALLDRMNAAAAASKLDAIETWAFGLAADRADMFSKFDLCLSITDALNAKVAAGRLAMQNEQIVADVISSENQILEELTAMQRLSSASLQRAFALGLPARIKELESAAAKLLAESIHASTDLAQFMSNELQNLAIFLKEHYKTVTHPLDENHPE